MGYHVRFGLTEDPHCHCMSKKALGQALAQSCRNGDILEGYLILRRNDGSNLEAADGLHSSHVVMLNMTLFR